MSIPTQPNKAAITARITGLKPTEDGWGMWADMEVFSIADVPGKKNFVTHLKKGESIRAFVSPPMLPFVIVGEYWTGHIMMNGGQNRFIYILVSS